MSKFEPPEICSLLASLQDCHSWRSMFVHFENSLAIIQSQVMKTMFQEIQNQQHVHKVELSFIAYRDATLRHDIAGHKNHWQQSLMSYRLQVDQIRIQSSILQGSGQTASKVFSTFASYFQPFSKCKHRLARHFELLRCKQLYFQETMQVK